MVNDWVIFKHKVIHSWGLLLPLLLAAGWVDFKMPPNSSLLGWFNIRFNALETDALLFIFTGLSNSMLRFIDSSIWFILCGVKMLLYIYVHFTCDSKRSRLVFDDNYVWVRTKVPSAWISTPNMYTIELALADVWFSLKF